MNIIAPYDQEDNPSDNIAIDDLNYQILLSQTKDKPHILDGVPILKPFRDYSDYNNTVVFATLSDSSVETFQIRNYNIISTNKTEKCLSNETDDTIGERVLTDNTKDINEIRRDSDINLPLNVAKIERPKEEPNIDAEAAPTEVNSDQNMVKEENINTIETIQKHFMPVLPPKNPYTLNTFRNTMRSRLKNIQTNKYDILNDNPSVNCAKWRSPRIIEPPKRVLRKKGESTKSTKHNLRTKRSCNDVEKFFLGTDIY